MYADGDDDARPDRARRGRDGGARSARARRSRRAWPNVVLAVLAGLGVTAFLTVLVTGLLGYRVALVSTGSMEPAMPAGSAALVHSVTADTVGLGDVVTVDREGALPIVHRVVAIHDPAERGDPTRDLTLRGDANPVDDPAPYRVDHVGLVMAVLPGAAPVIDRLRTPWVLGAVLIAVAGVALFALSMRGRDRGDTTDDPADVAGPG